MSFFRDLNRFFVRCIIWLLDFEIKKGNGVDVDGKKISVRSPKHVRIETYAVSLIATGKYLSSDAGIK